MDKLNVNPNNEDPTLQQKVLGKNIIHAPQAALSVPSTFTPSSGGSGSLGNGDSDILAKTTQRVLDIENALIKLGLLRHR
jgi:hypothetical protein